MTSILKSIVLAAGISLTLVPTIVSAACVTKSGWYVPYNCVLVGTDKRGKKIFTCCN